MKKSDRAPMKKAQRIGALLKEMLNRPGFGEQLSRHQAWLIWDQIVGEQIASRARPRKLRRGVLEIDVDHPVWMQQLHMLKPTILAKINARIPNAEISDIYLRQAKKLDSSHKLAKKNEPQELPWEKAELNKWEKKVIEDELTKLDDNELKQSLRSLLTKQKKVDKTGHSADEEAS